MTIPQLEEPIDSEDRAAITRLIAVYQPDRDDSNSVVKTLCLHTDISLLWNVVFTMVCRSDADVQHLTNLTIAIMDCAAASGVSETFIWLDRHRRLLGWQSRTSYDDMFSNADPAHLQHAGRRNLNAFLARLTAAGIANSRLFFFDAFVCILEPKAVPEWPDDGIVTVEDLVMLEDYFKFAGAWMRAQFGVKPVGSQDHMVPMLTFSEERWEQWKRSLKALADGDDPVLRSSTRNALNAMA